MRGACMTCTATSGNGARIGIPKNSQVAPTRREEYLFLQARVVRGGCWSSYASDCRAALRFDYQPGDWHYVNMGFRVALIAVP